MKIYWGAQVLFPPFVTLLKLRLTVHAVGTPLRERPHEAPVHVAKEGVPVSGQL